MPHGHPQLYLKSFRVLVFEAAPSVLIASKMKERPMIDVLSAGRQFAAEPLPNRSADELWLTVDSLHSATGWQLKPEGLCKDDVCIPLSGDRREKFVAGEDINASELWRALDRPVLHDASRKTWMLGEGAGDRGRRLESLQAPDFTLPDIEGKLHSLSDFRGQKVLLATWASW